MCKKVTTLFMAVFMILSCCISPAMAADSDLNYSEDMVQVPSELPGASDVSTCGFGGPAPLVTNIELYGEGRLSNGNYYITLKVTGYGYDRAYVDGTTRFGPFSFSAGTARSLSPRAATRSPSTSASPSIPYIRTLI